MVLLYLIAIKYLCRVLLCFVLNHKRVSEKGKNIGIVSYKETIYGLFWVLLTISGFCIVMVYLKKYISIF